jgi:hypothetical protein
MVLGQNSEVPLSLYAAVALNAIKIQLSIPIGEPFPYWWSRRGDSSFTASVKLRGRISARRTCPWMRRRSGIVAQPHYPDADRDGDLWPEDEA